MIICVNFNGKLSIIKISLLIVVSEIVKLDEIQYIRVY